LGRKKSTGSEAGKNIGFALLIGATIAIKNSE